MNITPNIFQKSIQRFAATSLGSKLFIPTAHRLDRIVLRLSGGRTTAVGLSAGLPVITLTTIGAKSGQLRTVPLVGIPDSDRWVVIASNFGQAHHPAWYYNLKQHPHATVTQHGRTGDYVAAAASGEEYDRLWQKAVSLYAGYAAYKTRTGGREIPIIVLTPNRPSRRTVLLEDGPPGRVCRNDIVDTKERGLPTMRTVPLGNTGVDVSIYCLGAMYLGTRNDAASSYRLLDQYMAAGGFFIDTANIYAHWVEGFRGGESETLLGAWLRARGNRSRIFLATKVGFQYPGVTIGLSAHQIEEECNKSLRRLGVDTIDLYYAHVDDRNTPMEETLGAFDRLVKVGKVRYIGASNFLAWRLAQAHALSVAHGWPDYCCVQQRYTYLRPKPGASFDPQLAVNDDLLDYCRSNPITLLAYSSLLSGAYTRPDRTIPEQYLGPDGDARLAALRQVAAAHGVSANQVILAWMLQSNPVVVPVMAAGSEAQMAENLAALNLVLSGDEMALLTNAMA